MDKLAYPYIYIVMYNAENKITCKLSFLVYQFNEFNVPHKTAYIKEAL